MANNATGNEQTSNVHAMNVPDHDWQGHTVEYDLGMQHNYQYRGNRETENVYYGREPFHSNYISENINNRNEAFQSALLNEGIKNSALLNEGIENSAFLNEGTVPQMGLPGSVFGANGSTGGRLVGRPWL